MTNVWAAIGLLWLAAACSPSAQANPDDGSGSGLVLTTVDGRVDGLPPAPPHVWCGDGEDGMVTGPSVHAAQGAPLDASFDVPDDRGALPNGWIIDVALADITPGEPISLGVTDDGHPSVVVFALVGGSEFSSSGFLSW